MVSAAPPTKASKQPQQNQLFPSNSNESSSIFRGIHKYPAISESPASIKAGTRAQKSKESTAENEEETNGSRTRIYTEDGFNRQGYYQRQSL